MADEKLEALKRRRRRWRLAGFYNLALSHGPIGIGQPPNTAIKTAQAALEVWEKANPGEYEDELLLGSGK